MVNRTEHFYDLGMQKSMVSRLVSSGRNSWIEVLSQKHLHHIDQSILPEGRTIVRPSLGENSLHLCMLSKEKCLIRGIYVYHADEIIKNIAISLINGLKPTVPSRNLCDQIADPFALIPQASGPAHQSHGMSFTNSGHCLHFLFLFITHQPEKPVEYGCEVGKRCLRTGDPLCECTIGVGKAVVTAFTHIY